MKLEDVRLTLLVDSDKICIKVEDYVACTVFLELELTPEQFARALSRQSCVECKSGEVFNLDRLGKKHEHKTLEFPLPHAPAWKERHAVAQKAAEQHCPEGWIPDSHYGSQNSFFEKDNKPWARCTIRRYVELDEED